MGGEAPPKQPVIFTKPWTSISINPIFTLPKHGREIHHETELGVVINKQATNINIADAYDYVGGYFLALDMTDRDLQAQLKKQGFPWDLAKGQDGFMPISTLIDKDNIKNPHNLGLELVINGKTVQQDNTGNMHFKIPELIAFISSFMTLNPGDLILTGTPSGVGPFNVNDKVHAILKQDDQIVAQIDLSVE